MKLPACCAFLHLAAADYEAYEGMTCWDGHGATEIDSDDTASAGQSAESCQAICDDDNDCDCVAFRLGDGMCWRRKACDPSQFGPDGDFNTYVKTDPASPPAPEPGPTPSSERLGSFLVIGDWGHDMNSHGDINSDSCQNTVAQAMDDTMSELGDVKFIVNVGDSFYPDGVTGKDDPQWDAKWRNKYSQTLRSIPWYSVYGNHDYHKDPGVCSDNVADGAQINDDIANLDYFYMPGYSWFKEHPELDLEVIAMDTNKFQNGWNHDTPASKQGFADCQWTACQSDCYGRISGRTDEAFQMFKERSEASTAKSLLVFSHYPTDYFWDQSSEDASSDFIARLSDNSKHQISYFGGHKHNVDQNVLSIGPNNDNNWLSGGGGGWSCDGSAQGFVVGEVAGDGTVTTRAVLVDPGSCCNALRSNATVAYV